MVSMEQDLFSQIKPWKSFWPVKPLLVHLYLKMEKPFETSCEKGTSVHIKNMSIKQT